MVQTRSGQRAARAPERESAQDSIRDNEVAPVQNMNIVPAQASMQHPEEHREIVSAQDVKTDLVEPNKEWDIGHLIDLSASLPDIRELAIGHRPGHEFISLRTKTMHGHLTYIYECCYKTCSVKRYIINNASKTEFVLFEDGEHESDHPPTHRRRYPYTRTQDRAIQTMFESNQEVSEYNAAKIMKELERLDIVRGLTVRQLKLRLKNDNLKKARVEQDNVSL